MEELLEGHHKRMKDNLGISADEDPEDLTKTVAAKRHRESAAIEAPPTKKKKTLALVP
jgi:hypothetical protein